MYIHLLHFKTLKQCLQPSVHVAVHDAPDIKNAFAKLLVKPLEVC